MAMAARIAMIATTIINSISVKPRCSVRMGEGTPVPDEPVRPCMPGFQHVACQSARLFAFPAALPRPAAESPPLLWREAAAGRARSAGVRGETGAQPSLVPVRPSMAARSQRRAMPLVSRKRRFPPSPARPLASGRAPSPGGEGRPMAKWRLLTRREARMKTLLVTGGAGFIGGNFVLQAVADGLTVVNLDKLTYAGNLDTLKSLEGNPRHVFVRGDIGDRALVSRLLAE